MAQPPAYVRAFSFTDYTANFPSAQQPGVRLDTEFNAVATTTAAIRANLARIQRDDGQLANASVGADQLSSEITIGLRSISDWAADTDYLVNDAAWRTGALYRCLENHTAGGSFATDLSGGKWILIYDFAAEADDIIAGAVANADITIDGNLVPTLAGDNAFTGANSYTDPSTVAVGAATTAADYAIYKPTDFGAGKPGLFLRKKAGATAWAFELDDGAGGSGQLDFVGSAILHNGAAVAAAADVADFTTSIRRARNLALTSR